MEVYIADIFDYCWEQPFVVGVYDTAQKAWDAIEIILNNVRKANPKTDDVNARFSACVTPTQLNSFSPDCIDWCYSG